MIVRNSRNQEMIIDEEDLHLLKPNRLHPGRYYFYLDKDGYANVSRNDKIVKFHNLVIGKPPEGLVTDHINRIENDNRKCNLRHVTRSVNNLNRRKPKNCSSKFRGVHFCKREQNFVSQLSINCSQKFIGYFKTELEAAKAFDSYVIENNLPNQINFPHEMSVAKS